MTFRRKKEVPPAGEIRQSQVLRTFGPGSMVDLPNHSVLIGGLDHWQFGERRRIFDDRLEARLCELLDLDEVQLYEPPPKGDSNTGPRTGITAFLFPSWFLAQVDETFEAPDGRIYRTRPMVPWNRLVRGKYLDRDKKPKPVVPIRFVQACVKGHISDIDWYGFVRQSSEPDRRGQLWFDEGGAGNDFADIYIRDPMNNNWRRPLADATVHGGRVLGRCSGHSPWLGPRAQEPCENDNRLLVRSASNAYFSQTLSVIAIPDTQAELREAVDEVFEDHLMYCDSLEEVIKERLRTKVMYVLQGLDNADIWAEIERRKKGVATERRSIKDAEITTLLSSPDSVGKDVPDGDFYARARSFKNLRGPLQGRLDQVVLVHRLREVIAQVGFTRFEHTMPDIDGELNLNVELAPLASETTWLPAIENKGEGVFLSFLPEALEDWLTRPGVQRRAQQLRSGYESWGERKGIDKEKLHFPGLPYFMLHSLSHLLITAVSLGCGYSASAIRERVYAGENGYGILLYTGSPGSEGTLGGLVDVGRNIEYHLAQALELGRLCSNDPVCAQHEAANQHEERFLHGAACHGCLLIAETSCEQRNELLDRALVVPTVATPDAAFFEV